MLPTMHWFALACATRNVTARKYLQKFGFSPQSLHKIELQQHGGTLALPDGGRVDWTIRGPGKALPHVGINHVIFVAENKPNAIGHHVAAMEKHNIKRFIHIGGAVHPGGENENWTMGRRLLRIFLNLSWKPGLVAKQLEWEVLKVSNLDWTLVRPPKIIKGGSTGKVKADEENLIRTKINVEDLSNFILDQINSRRWIKKAPLVASVR